MKRAKHILLVDDNEVDNFITEHLLKNRNAAHLITTKTSAGAALDFLEHQAKEMGMFPDYIFLDISMPRMDGFEFLKQFSKFPETMKANCSIFMLTSSEDEKDREKVKYNKLVKKFLQKPLSDHEIKEPDLLNTDTMQVETTTLIINKIKNSMEVVKSWREKRDRKLTLALMKSQVEEAKKTSATENMNMNLSSGPEQDSLKSAFTKIDACFAWYHTVLSSGDFYEGEVDDAAKGLITCIGEELAHLNGLTEDSTENTIRNFWMEYGGNEQDE